MEKTPLRDFMNHIGTAKTPLMGGGSVAAVCGALSGALAGLVGSLSTGSQEDPGQTEKFQSVMADAEAIRETLLKEIERDANSFGGVMKAFKLPKDTDQERAYRSDKIQEGYMEAIAVPLGVAETSCSLFPLIEFLFVHGNKNAQTDVLVAAMCAKTSVMAAGYNVKVNLLSVKDTISVEVISEKLSKMEEYANQYETKILALSSL
jgi:formiminotetrahydrofolate cyclodeaminase